MTCKKDRAQAHQKMRVTMKKCFERN